MFSKISEKPLDGDQLQLINRIKSKSLHEVNDENEKCRSVETNDESVQQEQADASFDDWMTAHAVSSDVDTPHRSNELFMYNFFRRRQCADRTTLYLSKIESMKGEKIRKLVSEIRQIPIAFIPLPQERVGAEESRKREMKHRQAKESAKRLCLGNKVN